jgi:hypothetical protein
MREGQESYGIPIAEKVRTHLRERRWRSAIGGMLVLLWNHPRRLALLSERRMERHRLVRRFWNRTRELQTRERKLETQQHALKRQKRALEKERREIRQLRLQVQSLDRRLHELRGSRTWELVQRLKKSLDRRERRDMERVAGAKNVGSLRSYGTLVEMEQKTRFFLVGEMKSGTSWLMNMLNSHPEVFCGAEGTFFGRHRATDEIPVYEAPAPSLYNAFSNSEGLRTWQSLWWNRWTKGRETEGWTKRREMEEDLHNLTRLTIDYYLAKRSAESGKRIVGDKSPQHTEYVDEIFDFYPEAKVIHIFRDGRDVAVSLMHHFWNLSRDEGKEMGIWGDRGIFDLEPEEIDKRDAYLGDPEAFLASGGSIFIEERLRQMAARWSRTVSKASREGSTLFGSSFFQLSYEDLLENPRENLEAILDFLNAQVNDSIVRQCVEENSFEMVAGRPKGREDGRSFFRKGVAGDWRRVFTERDRRVYEKIAGDALLEMGYSIGR